MYRQQLRRTFLVLLCCILLVSAIGMSEALRSPFDTALTKLWNWITGLKDTVEGINTLIAALETDIKECEDKIAQIKNRKNGHLGARNETKRKIQPKEQEQNQAERDKSAAAAAHDVALEAARSLRQQIADIEAELRWISGSDSRYLELQQALFAKRTALSIEEGTIAAEKEKYNKARATIKRIRAELRSDRQYIAYLTRLIDQCDEDIAAQEAKITKKRAEITAETERRAKVEADIEKREAEWEKLKKDAKKPKSPQI